MAVFRYQVDATTALENGLPPSQVGVFPNPLTHNRVWIVLPADAGLQDYQLFDSTGRILAAGRLQEGRVELILPDLSEGVYFLRIGERVVKKLVKQ